MTSLFSLFPDIQEILSGSKPVPVCEKPTLILAITARTGSTNLCSILEKKQILGVPEEILNVRGVAQHLKTKHSVDTFTDYIKALAGQPGDYFCFKTAWIDFEPISNLYAEIFPNATFVFLDRFDVVAQAISFYRAKETGEWHRSASEVNNTIKSKLPDEVDAEQVLRAMKTLMDQKLQWERFFFSNEISSYHFYYEIMQNDWAKTANAIVKWIGRGDVASNANEAGRYSRIADEHVEQRVAEFKKNNGLTWLLDA